MATIEIISDAGVADFEGALPEGVRVEHITDYHEFDSTGGSWPVLEMIFSGVSSSLVAAILYDVIKKAAKKRSKEAPKSIQIDRTEIVFEHGEISKYIEERIKIEE
jgi:hypothetical protein